MFEDPNKGMHSPLVTSLSSTIWASNNQNLLFWIKPRRCCHIKVTHIECSGSVPQRIRHRWSVSMACNESRFKNLFPAAIKTISKDPGDRVARRVFWQSQIIAHPRGPFWRRLVHDPQQGLSWSSVWQANFPIEKEDLYSTSIG